jgi:hypothetical protein
VYICTSNKLGRAPPSVSADLKSEIFPIAI